MRRILPGLLLLSMALGAAACGDDDDSESTSITKEEFVERANQVCAEGDGDLEGVPEPESLEEATDIIRERLIPSLRRQIDEIRDIGFPEADRERLSDTFDRAEEVLDEVEADVEGALESQEDPFDEVNEELADYGLDECAS